MNDSNYKMKLTMATNATEELKQKCIATAIHNYKNILARIQFDSILLDKNKIVALKLMA